MTPADKLAAVVAKWRAKADLWDADPDYQKIKHPASEVACANVRRCADDIEPILAELQRAQGRLTGQCDFCNKPAFYYPAQPQHVSKMTGAILPCSAAEPKKD